MDKDDVECVNTLFKTTSVEMKLGLGFCSSYKRLVDKTKRGTHSPALVDIIGLMNALERRNKDKIILHYSPSNYINFYDEVCSLLEFDHIRNYIDILFITGIYPNPNDIKRIKQRYGNIDITVQLPLYRMQNTSFPIICKKLLEYEKYVDYVSIDNSGGKGIENDVDYSIQLINYMKKYDRLKWFIAGGVYGGNAKDIIEKVFLATSECVSIDAESRLRYEGKLSLNKVTDYVLNANAAYRDLHI